ncbi:hypothetical protein FVE85_1644 [Porphyridium purpureum]|uniref:SPRY domain-containing protein n=1 Tax=Porphyridium purpureum TaxID=35688 RepID=A0A5J4YVG5_PORPP|nr:hypothetical protein FVE85_1644 [Porphyridium purpureum]|eukprot:POR0301..scf209_3
MDGLKHCVGLETCRVQRPPPEHELAPSGHDSSVNLGIMHRQVNDQLFYMRVQKNASADTLGYAFRVNPEFVSENWITGGSELREYEYKQEVVTLENDSIEKRALSAVDRARLSFPVSPTNLMFALQKAACDAEGPGHCGGFSQVRKHEGLTLTAQSLVEKHGSSLFCSVQSKLALHRADGLVRYVEFSVHGNSVMEQKLPSSSERPGCGVCFGLATDELQPNRMPGTNSSSVGYYATGDVLCDNSYFGSHPRVFEGDVVGMLVKFYKLESPRSSASRVAAAAAYAASSSSRVFSLLTSSGASGLSSTCIAGDQISTRTLNDDKNVQWLAQVSFYINGKLAARAPRPLAASSDIQLYPTVSLYHKDVKVSLRCCKNELQYLPQSDIEKSLSDSDGTACVTLCGQTIDFAKALSHTEEDCEGESGMASVLTQESA